ncbi:MAG: transcriptional regulator [Clostridia bacterium]|nr:transcriptional regulator [Clostridia bacterium]
MEIILFVGKIVLMMDFIDFVLNILEEQGKTTQSLFDEIISENTFYKYRHRYPSLPTLIKLANYLEVSIDYLLERSDDNRFKPYTIDSQAFYSNLLALMRAKKISGRKLCKELSLARISLSRWKNGTLPSLQKLIEIADYFGCTIDDLLFE